MMNIIETIEDPNLFQPWFDGASWDGWKTILKAAFALPMSEAEREFFRSVAEREPPAAQARELWVVAGRRAGKDSIASVIAAQAASFFEPAGRLRGGERAAVMCLAVDRSQATIVLNYVRSYFQDIPYLAATVQRETRDGFELSNGVDVVIATNSYRSVRGRAVLLAIFDEAAFWRSDASVAPDAETYNAIVPGMATLPGAMLVGITSPHRKSGLAYERWRDHYGRAGDVLVVRSPSLRLNPTIDRRIIDDAMARDAAVARAEWLAEWRDDLAQFIDRAVVEAAVDVGVTVRAAVPGQRYYAFADPSGGASDSFTLAVGHIERDVVVLDCLVERHAPFNPHDVTEELAGVLKGYGLRECTGDRYAGAWWWSRSPSTAWRTGTRAATAARSTSSACRCSWRRGSGCWTAGGWSRSSRRWSGGRRWVGTAWTILRIRMMIAATWLRALRCWRRAPGSAGRRLRCL